MPVTKPILFSQRLKKSQAVQEDVYKYDDIPEDVRIKILYVLKEDIYDTGHQRPRPNIRPDSVLETLRNILLREYGKFYLYSPHSNVQADLLDFFTHRASYLEALDIIEISLRGAENVIGKNLYDFYGSTDGREKIIPDAIEEVNYRLREAGIGYEYIDGLIIRKDSQFTHEEVVKPVLSILNAPEFSGVQEEFLQAHEHYTHGRNKEAVNEALKSFESFMKAICKIKGWEYKESDTAKSLLAILKDKGFFPNYMQSHLESLVQILVSGAPTIRNKTSGHGQGAEIKTVSPEVAGYAINTAASSMLFLESILSKK